MMSEPKYSFGPMRLPFLILTPACVFLGVAAAVWTAGRVSLLGSVLALVGGLATHISVNALNEYHDFTSGLDARTTRTPFSGGSGALPEAPGLARSALLTGLIALAITILIGGYFVLLRGLLLIPLGVLGILVIVTYTPWLSHNPLACLIAPGLGFGPLMVMGTSFALTGSYSWTAFIASLVPFFLVSDLLLLNQFPDVEADRSVGRRHLPIAIGRRASSFVYAAFLLLAFLSILLGVLFGYLPKASLLGLAAALIALPAAFGAIRHAEAGPRLLPSMGLNVLVNVVTPVLVAVGLIVG
jgi:1,4-dihydroxy-2-naphthoate octaprenyltransferase